MRAPLMHQVGPAEEGHSGPPSSSLRLKLRNRSKKRPLEGAQEKAEVDEGSKARRTFFNLEEIQESNKSKVRTSKRHNSTSMSNMFTYQVRMLSLALIVANCLLLVIVTSTLSATLQTHQVYPSVPFKKSIQAQPNSGKFE